MITEPVEQPQAAETLRLLATLFERVERVKGALPDEIELLRRLIEDEEHFPTEVRTVLPGYKRVLERAVKGEPCDPRSIMSRVGFLLAKKLRALARSDKESFESLVDVAWQEHEGGVDPLIERIKKHRAAAPGSSLGRMSSEELEALCADCVNELADRAVYFKDYEGNAGAKDDNPGYYLARVATLATSVLYRILFRYARLRYAIEDDYMPIIISANKTTNKKELAEWEDCLGWNSLMTHERVRDPALKLNQYISDLLERMELIRWYFTHPNYQGKKQEPTAFERCVLTLPSFSAKTWKCWEALIWETVVNESPSRSPENHPVIGEVADNYAEALEEQFEAQRRSGRRKGDLTSGEITEKIRKYLRNKLAEKVRQFAPATPRYR